MTEFPIKANVQPAVKDIDQLINALRKAGVEAGLTEKEINDITSATRKVKEEGTKNIGAVNDSMSHLNNTVKTIGTSLLAAFTVDKVIDFGKQVVAITAEFQKFEAVLTNTLGSKSAAQRALADITKFASVTPFSVRELTESFVKLANQGFKPTMEQMRKLGDIASSTGKSFDQLAEAILDGQTGQFERLKEFGIKAQKQGDQVTFTFKGVATQVEYTNDAMRDYLVSLGDVEGVSGSMAAISATLGGQISNLGDNWNNLLLTLGEGNSGVMFQTVGFLQTMLAGITDLIETTDQYNKRLRITDQNQDIKSFEAFAKAYQDRNKAFEVYLQMLDEEEIKLKQTNDAVFKSGKSDGEFDKRYARLKAIEDERNTLTEYNAELDKEAALKKNIADDKAYATAQEQEIARLKQLTDERKAFLKTFLKEGTTDPTEEAGGNPFATVPFYDAKALDADTKRVAEGMNSTSSIGDPATIDDKADERKKIEQAAFNFSAELIYSLAQMQNAADEQERARLREKYDYELNLAGNNEDAKAAIKRKFDAEDKAIKQREALRNRETALFDIGVNTSRAIMSALATSNVPLSIFAGATGLLQLVKVLGTPLPKYADGVFKFDGQGSETSDSNLALLSRNESVASARVTHKFGDILKPMIENKDFDYADIRNIINSKLPDRYLPMVIGANSGGYDERVLEKLSSVEKTIANKKEVRLEFDKNGFGQWVGKQGDWTKYVSDRYKI